MISAVILAAGQATRFGECKQLVRLGGKTLLEHALDAVKGSNVDDVVVVLGANADEIRRQIAFGNVRVVLNPDYAGGMSTSIQAGLRVVTGEAAMIVLGDQPFVASATLNALIDEYRRTGASVVIPMYKGFRGNPVIVNRSLFAEMMNIRGDIGCRAIFGDHADSIVKVPVDNRGVITDIDTMEDFDKATRSFAVGACPERAKRVERAAQDDKKGAAQDLDKATGSFAVSAAQDDRKGAAQDLDKATGSFAVFAAQDDSAPRDLLETIVDLRRRRQAFAVATVVRAERPTSSKPGDKAIIAPDGTLTGWIGGSCAHDIVVKNALESLEAGTPRFLTLSSTSPTAAREGVIDVPMQCYSGGVLDVFIEPSLPPAQLVVVGNETIAHALVRIGRTLQFHVTVVDPSATPATFPDADEIVNELKLQALPLGRESFIVVATHGRYDEEALEQATQTGAPYIALVASPKRGRVILQQLRERGVIVEQIKSPAGLDIGAEGAEEVALSIVAEIVQLRRAGKLKVPSIAATAPAEAIDPICNMTVNVASAHFTAEHEGRRYYFCCAHCQRTFEQEPHRYAHVA